MEVSKLWTLLPFNDLTLPFGQGIWDKMWSIIWDKSRPEHQHRGASDNINCKIPIFITITQCYTMWTFFPCSQILYYIYTLNTWLRKKGVHDKHDATDRRFSISSWIILLCVMTGIWTTHYSYWLRMQYRSHIVLNHMIVEHSGTTECAVGGGSYYI